MANIIMSTLEPGLRGLSIRHLAPYIRSLGHNCEMLFLYAHRATADKPIKFTEVQIDAIVNFLIQKQTDFLGFYVMTGTFLPVKDLISIIKQKIPGLKTMLGGVHPTICPEESLKETETDFIIMGDGEIPLKELLGNRPYSKIKGLGYRRKESFHINGKSDFFWDLDEIPFPDFEFANEYFLKGESLRKLTFKDYSDNVGWGGKYYYLTTSRGCPYVCSYCSNLGGKKIRRRSVDSVLHELNYYYEKLRFKGINIQDDSFFLGDDRYLKEYCDKVQVRFSNIPFVARVMPAFVKEHRIKLLHNHGLEYVSIGLQGSDRLNADLYKRRENNKTFINACCIMSDLNVKFVVDVLLDNPYETEDDLREIVQTLCYIPKPYTVLAYGLTPFPGTLLYETAKRDGKLDEFGTDPYISMFRATKANCYSTPLHWRQLIEDIVPFTNNSVVLRLLKRIHEKDIRDEISSLARKNRKRINIVNKFRSKFPTMFTKCLNLYFKGKRLLENKSVERRK